MIRTLASILVFLGGASMAAAQTPTATIDALAREFREAKAAFDQAADYSPAPVARQAEQLKGFRQRLDALPTASWPLADRIDALVVKAEMNQLDFEHRVLRSPSRNPEFYVQRVMQGLPDDPSNVPEDRAAALAARLRKAPALLESARANLTEVSHDHADIALRSIERVPGVRVQQSAVDRLAWVARLSKETRPELSQAAAAAGTAMAAYGKWIHDNIGRMTARGGIGIDNYNWYLKNVLIMPYTADQLMAIAEREWARTTADLAYEENRNRTRPALKPAATEAEYDKLARDNDRFVRQWLVERNIISIPDYVEPMGATVPWHEGGKAGQATPRHYWQEIQFRDTLPDHIHAGIPGHKYDGIVSRRHPRFVRRGHSDSGRTEGWGFYLEEMALQSGLLDDRPRTRELFYNFQLFRYLRTIVDIKMASGEMNLQQATEFLKTSVPLMEEQVAYIDASGYFLRPTAGTTYTAGKFQMETLVAHLRMQRGDAFNLRDFHDRFMAAGSIPIALIEWELTGRDDAVRRLSE